MLLDNHQTTSGAGFKGLGSRACGRTATQSAALNVSLQGDDALGANNGSARNHEATNQVAETIRVAQRLKGAQLGSVSQSARHTSNDGFTVSSDPVSYTHLTLPTNREV